MTAKQIATLLATVLFAAAAYAGEKGDHKMEIKIIADDGETHLMLDSDDLGFNLHDMQIGENRSIVDKEGRAILVTRGEESFSFDVDGKTIDVLLFEGHEDGNVWVSKGDHRTDVDVRVMRMGDHKGKGPHRMMNDEGVVIFSGKEIDEATQQVIRTALESAGHQNVHFAGGDNDGPHGVHVIEKVVEVEVTE